MEPVWLKSYQPGVPTTIDPDAYSSLNAMYSEIFTKFKDLPAYTNMGQVITYTQLDQASRNFAAFLQNKLAVPVGERIAIMMPNIIQYPISMIGIMRAGCTVVNINPLFTEDEFLHEINDAQPIALVVLENFAHTITEVIKRTSIKYIIVAKISDVFPPKTAWLAEIYVKYIKRMVKSWHFDTFYWFKDALEQGAKLEYKELPVSGQDIAFLQYTGGTTGVSKGAMLTHRNMVANLLQASAWISKEMEPGKEIVVTAIPMYHIFSLTANCLTFLNYGALNVLITDPRDIKSFLKDLKKYKFTAITGVNTLFNLLLNAPDFAKLDFSNLKLALGGGMAVQKSVAERWENLTKSPLLEAYGLTEASPAVCINPMNLRRFNGTIGLPISSTDISIRDDQGKELPLNKPGELWVRGPQVMLGYWHQDEETKNVLTADGWLKTGDIANVDDKGFVHLVDRKKDMILVSGFNVYPNEVEDVIAAMPGVKEVAVIGRPDGGSGEEVVAYIVKSDPSITEASVRVYCHQHLTGYKVPKHVEFRDSLPKSNVGKILRREIK
jgi:long-chain acyl-CoA synthetase